MKKFYVELSVVLIVEAAHEKEAESLAKTRVNTFPSDLDFYIEEVTEVED